MQNACVYHVSLRVDLNHLGNFDVYLCLQHPQHEHLGSTGSRENTNEGSSKVPAPLNLSFYLCCRYHQPETT